MADCKGDYFLQRILNKCCDSKRVRLGSNYCPELRVNSIISIVAFKTERGCNY